MKEFSCGDVVPGCSASFSASSEEEIFARVASHASADHDVHEITAELVEAVRKNIRHADHA